MSKEKNLSIFSPQIEAIVLFILQIFFRNMRMVLKFGGLAFSDNYFPVLAGENSIM